MRTGSTLMPKMCRSAALCRSLTQQTGLSCLAEWSPSPAEDEKDCSTHTHTMVTLLLTGSSAVFIQNGGLRARPAQLKSQPRTNSYSPPFVDSMNYRRRGWSGLMKWFASTVKPVHWTKLGQQKLFVLQSNLPFNGIFIEEYKDIICCQKFVRANHYSLNI